MSLGDGLTQDQARRRVWRTGQQVRSGAQNAARKTSQRYREMGECSALFVISHPVRFGWCFSERTPPLRRRRRRSRYSRIRSKNLKSFNKLNARITRRARRRCERWQHNSYKMSSNMLLCVTKREFQSGCERERCCCCFRSLSTMRRLGRCATKRCARTRRRWVFSSRKLRSLYRRNTEVTLTLRFASSNDASGCNVTNRRRNSFKMFVFFPLFPLFLLRRWHKLLRCYFYVLPNKGVA